MQPDSRSLKPLPDLLAEDSLEQRNSLIARYAQAFWDNNPEVHRPAAEALVKLGGTAVPALIHILKTSSRGVRSRATQALSQIGVAAIPVLIELIDEDDGDIRFCAAAALQIIGDAQTLPLRVLADNLMVASEKLDTLEALRQIRPQKDLHLHYSLPPIGQYCGWLLERDDIDHEAEEGSRAVLKEIKRRSDAQVLVRATARDLTAEEEELLRATSPSPNTAAPSELVQASKVPTEGPPSQSRLKKYLYAIRDRFSP